MKYILRALVTLGAIVAVYVALTISGTLDFLRNFTGIGTTETPAAVQPAQIDPQTTPSAPGASSTLHFTWRGEEILYNENVITEEEFAQMVTEAQTNGNNIEITQASDVTVETADRRRLLLDEAGVTYEIISQ